MRPRLQLCEWCALPVKGNWLRLSIETDTSTNQAAGVFCDPSCIRSWADGQFKPSERPGRTVIIATVPADKQEGMA